MEEPAAEDQLTQQKQFHSGGKLLPCSCSQPAVLPVTFSLSSAESLPPFQHYWTQSNKLEARVKHHHSVCLCRVCFWVFICVSVCFSTWKNQIKRVSATQKLSCRFSGFIMTSLSLAPPTTAAVNKRWVFRPSIFTTITSPFVWHPLKLSSVSVVQMWLVPTFPCSAADWVFGGSEREHVLPFLPLPDYRFLFGILLVSQPPW